MAQAGGNGGDSKLNTELNLVPFIDLLSSLVLFLLLTVVWVQVAAIQVGVDTKGKSAVSETVQSKLLVQVSKDGVYRLTWPGSLKGFTLPGSVRQLADLEPLMKNLVKAAKIPPAAVSGDDSVEYGKVVQALDSLKSLGIDLVTLSTD